MKIREYERCKADWNGRERRLQLQKRWQGSDHQRNVRREVDISSTAIRNVGFVMVKEEKSDEVRMEGGKERAKRGRAGGTGLSEPAILAGIINCLG